MISMKTTAAALIGVALSLGAAAPSVAAPAPAHDGHAAGVTELSLNQGRKWATDAPLRQGMTAIRETMAQNLSAMHGDGYTPAHYAALAAALEGEVAGIALNCRLPPAADAQLHVVLAGILDGIEGLKSGSTRMQGTMKVLRSLVAYGTYFEHSGWQPIGH